MELGFETTFTWIQSLLFTDGNNNNPHVLRAYYVSGVLAALSVLTHWIFTPPRMILCSILVWQRKKGRCREVQYPPQGHTAYERWWAESCGCGVHPQNHFSVKAADFSGTIFCCVALLTLPTTFTKRSYFILVTGLVVKGGRRQRCQVTSVGTMMPTATWTCQNCSDRGK